MTEQEWEQQVPRAIRDDSVWKMKAYKLGLFLSDLAWLDAGKLLRDVRTVGIADQLCRAVGKISACVAEGYSRGTGKSRATFYEYALGSTRETRDWYYKGRRVLREKVANHRIELCAELIRLLIRMTDNERSKNRRLTRSAPDHIKLITTH